MTLHDGRGVAFDMDVDLDALATQQVALLLDRPVHQRRHQEAFAVLAVVGFAGDAQEHLDRGLHLGRGAADAVERLDVLGRQVALLQQFDRAGDHRDRRAQLVAGRAGEVALAHHERADALERLLRRHQSDDVELAALHYVHGHGERAGASTWCGGTTGARECSAFNRPTGRPRPSSPHARSAATTAPRPAGPCHARPPRTLQAVWMLRASGGR